MIRLVLAEVIREVRALMLDIELGLADGVESDHQFSQARRSRHQDDFVVGQPVHFRAGCGVNNSRKQIRRDVELADFFRFARQFLEGKGDELLRPHAGAGKRLEDLRVSAAQCLHGARHAVGPGVRLGLGIVRRQCDQTLAPVFQADVAIQALPS